MFLNVNRRTLGVAVLQEPAYLLQPKVQFGISPLEPLQDKRNIVFIRRNTDDTWIHNNNEMNLFNSIVQFIVLFFQIINKLTSYTITNTIHVL